MFPSQPCLLEKRVIVEVFNDPPGVALLGVSAFAHRELTDVFKNKQTNKNTKKEFPMVLIEL